MTIAPGLFRLLLAMVVVLHHSTPLRLGTWAVGLFFCLSGFWIAQMWSCRYSRLDRPYLSFWMSRWWRLAPVLLSTTLLAACDVALGFVIGDKALLSRWTWWATQPAIAGSTQVGRLLPPAWSLDVEMQFYLVAPAMVALATRLDPVARCIVAVLALIWCVYLTAIGKAGESPRLDLWLGLFWLGVIASVARWRWNRAAVLASGGFTLAVMAAAMLTPTLRPWIWLRGSAGPAPVGLPTALLTVGTVVSSVPLALATTCVRSGRMDRFLGDLSYPLYLFHWLPRQWYYAHLGAHPQPLHAAALLGLNLLASLAGALVLLVFVDIPAQRFRARWVNGRTLQPTDSTSTAEPSHALAGTV